MHINAITYVDIVKVKVYGSKESFSRFPINVIYTRHVHKINIFKAFFYIVPYCEGQFLPFNLLKEIVRKRRCKINICSQSFCEIIKYERFKLIFV